MDEDPQLSDEDVRRILHEADDPDREELARMQQRIAQRILGHVSGVPDDADSWTLSAAIKERKRKLSQMSGSPARIRVQEEVKILEQRLPFAKIGSVLHLLQRAWIPPPVVLRFRVPSYASHGFEDEIPSECESQLIKMKEGDDFYIVDWWGRKFHARWVYTFPLGPIYRILRVESK